MVDNIVKRIVIYFLFCICGIVFLKYIFRNEIVEFLIFLSIVKFFFKMILVNYI